MEQLKNQLRGSSDSVHDILCKDVTVIVDKEEQGTLDSALRTFEILHEFHDENIDEIIMLLKHLLGVKV